MQPSDKIMNQWQIRVITDMMEEEFNLRGYDAASEYLATLDLPDDLHQYLANHLTELIGRQKTEEFIQ